MPAEGAIVSLLVGEEGMGPSGGSNVDGIGMNQMGGKVAEGLRSVAGDFDGSVGERVESLAEETGSDDLRKAASEWKQNADDADGYDTAFEDEQEAVDWLVKEITDAAGSVKLDDDEEEKLREAVAEEYADAALAFRQRVEEDEDLQRVLRMRTLTKAARRLDGIADSFRRLSGRRPYALHEFLDGGLPPGLEDTFDGVEAAVRYYERTVEEEGDAEARNNYAVLLHRQDETEHAAEQYKKAIELYPRLAEARYNYGVLLLDDGRADEAREHLETAARLWKDRQEFRSALHALRRLVEACLETEDEEAVVKYSQTALKILNTAPEEDLDEERRWFGTVRMLTRPDDVNTQDLHGSALLNVEAGKTEEAVELFETAWERHERHDEESEIGEYRASVAAGVALAAYLETDDGIETSWTADEILARVETDDLHEAPRAVYDRIAGTDDGSDSEDLRRLSKEYEEDDQNLAATEAGAFASLLERLEASA